MNITFRRKTDLAIRAIQRLADTPRPVSRHELADSVGASLPFIAQVMSPLVGAGWVISERGPGGGYRLATEPERISLLAVIEAVEGDTVTGRCALRDGPCPGTESCPIHEAWTAARASLVERLQSTPVSEAIGDIS